MIRRDADGVRLDILVQPRASRARVGPVHGDRLKVAVTAPPVDGKANAAVVQTVAKHLSVARRDVEVVSGHGSRRKTIHVRGLGVGDVQRAIGVET